jgi:hypothetical protein
MGCCLFATIAAGVPRLTLIFIWLLTNWYNAFDTKIVAFLSWLCFPYTSMAWMYIYFNNGGHIDGGYFLLFIITIALDIGCNVSGTKGKKQ